MKKVFKILAVILLIAFVMGAFAACGKGEQSKDTNKDEQSTVANIGKDEIQKLKGEWRADLPESVGDQDFESRVGILTINADGSCVFQEKIVVDKAKYKEECYNNYKDLPNVEKEYILGEYGADTFEEAFEMMYLECVEETEETTTENFEKFEDFANNGYEFDGDTLTLRHNGTLMTFKKA